MKIGQIFISFNSFYFHLDKTRLILLFIWRGFEYFLESCVTYNRTNLNHTKRKCFFPNYTLQLYCDILICKGIITTYVSSLYLYQVSTKTERLKTRISFIKLISFFEKRIDRVCLK